jgi:hypothetical protein
MKQPGTVGTLFAPKTRKKHLKGRYYNQKPLVLTQKTPKIALKNTKKRLFFIVFWSFFIKIYSF